MVFGPTAFDILYYTLPWPGPVVLLSAGNDIDINHGLHSEGVGVTSSPTQFTCFIDEFNKLA